MLLTRMNRSEHPLADFDPFASLSLFNELWPSSLIQSEAIYMPAMDVAETDKEYKVRLEAPGMSKEDIKVEFENSILTISGEKKQEEEERTEKTHRVERRYGAFTRSLRFSDVDQEKISATCKDGVLSVTVPKTGKALPKKISIE
ncbi:MAG: Hsp20/alpha crystallin family protein [Nitrospinae bacterium]|nr:Hsp20/alpha crystallin family protein [Nitrospinota bacterium]